MPCGKTVCNRCIQSFSRFDSPKTTVIKYFIFEKKLKYFKF